MWWCKYFLPCFHLIDGWLLFNFFSLSVAVMIDCINQKIITAYCSVELTLCGFMEVSKHQSESRRSSTTYSTAIVCVCLRIGDWWNKMKIIVGIAAVW
jgi:hypothetical protein